MKSIDANKILANIDDFILSLTYANYEYNRNRSPKITPEQWKKVYGEQTDRLERVYQLEQKKKELAHQCCGCEYLKDGYCLDCSPEPIEADNVIQCGIRDELWADREHNPEKCGCHYIGFNMWDCGHTDGEGG